MASFDSDSSFWVCDNSATGHICNDRSLFHGELVPSTFSVSAATGTSETNLMGTIVLSVQDDDGVEHTFTLREVVYMKDSPVYLLSTRRLAEQFPDEAGDQIAEAQESCCSSKSTRYFGTTSIFRRPSTPLILGCLNAFSIQASRGSKLIIAKYRERTTTPLAGPSPTKRQKGRIDRSRNFS